MSGGDRFVGRGAELATMAGELDVARSGRPRVLLVEGASGIGKTSLIRCFLGRRPEVPVLWGGGDEGETGLPFGVLAQLVAGVPHRLLGPQLGAGPPPEADPLTVGAELLSVLGGLQASGPVVVVVDDAQWVDDPSVRALVFVVRRLRRDQVLVVLGVRDDAPGEAAWWNRNLTQADLVRRLRLGGLDAEEIVELSEAVGGPALTPAAGRRLQEHTGGHPLHARALLAELPPEALADTGRVLPAPRSLGSLVLVRVAKLSTPAQELVLAAAVLGSRCTLAEAVTLAAVPDPLAALDEAVGAGLLNEVLTGTGHDLTFSHELVRAAVYVDIPPAKRHALHLAAAGLLGGAAAIGHRVAAAVGPDPALAAELTELGQDDLDARRWRPAADHLMAAAELSGTAHQRAARLVAAAGAMLAGGDLGRALRLEPDIRAGPPAPGRDGVLGRLEALSGRFAAARTTLTAAVQATDGDRPLASAHLALLSFVEGASDAAELAGEALAAHPAPEVATLAQFVRVMGLAAQGRHDEAAAELTRHGDGSTAPPETAAMRGVLALWADDVAAAAAALSDVVRDGAPPMSVQARVIVLGHLAEASYRIGDWDGAAAAGALAVSLARDAGVLLGAGITNALASYVAVGRGEWETARSRVAAATAAAGLLPWWAARAHAASARAVLAQAQSDHAAMDEALQPYTDPAVLGPVERIGALPWRVLRIEASLGLGRVAEAEAALADLEARLAGRTPGWSALEAARLRSEIAELRAAPDTVRREYQGALALAVRVPAELSRARLETACGRYLLAAGDRRPAVDLLRTARGRLERLGAAPFLAKCDELLRSAGLHPPAAGGPLGLTAQEIAVARLVAEGRTNQEAGAALFVTGRTVAFHLSNIYAKLGVSSRRELAVHLTHLT